MATQSHHRVLSLKLQRKRYPAELVERYIQYRGAKLDLTDALYDELLAVIPDVWNTDKDRLTQFVLFEDNTWMSVRCKDIYNFGRKETEQKTYFYDAATDAQVANLSKVVTNFFGVKKVAETADFYDTVMSNLSDMSYMKQKLKNMRLEALYRSDFMFNSDYTFKDADLEQKWKTYRQEWRDITDSEAWQNNDFVNISVPVAPRPQDTLEIMLGELKKSLVNVDATDALLNDMAIAVDCQGYEETAKNFGELSFKLEILKVLGKLKLPFNNNIGDPTEDIEQVEEGLARLQLIPMDVYTRYKSVGEVEDDQTPGTMKSLLDEQLASVDAKIDAINAKLAEYNVGYSIADIMAKYVEDTKAQAAQHDLDEEAERLLEEVEEE
tara:strand:- start:1628 stop:2770 length:1143 start_codon:yes stop_codon:yes gene_type:complete